MPVFPSIMGHSGSQRDGQKHIPGTMLVLLGLLIGVSAIHRIDPWANLWVIWADVNNMLEFCSAMASATDLFWTCLIGILFLNSDVLLIRGSRVWQGISANVEGGPCYLGKLTSDHSESIYKSVSYLKKCMRKIKGILVL